MEYPPERGAVFLKAGLECGQSTPRRRVNSVKRGPDRVRIDIEAELAYKTALDAREQSDIMHSCGQTPGVDDLYSPTDHLPTKVSQSKKQKVEILRADMKKECLERPI